jgi:tetratricopeptide (TPR) repeat protein
MRLILSSCIILFFFSCHPPTNQDTSGTHPGFMTEVLADQNLYNLDSVVSASHLVGALGPLQGKKLFLRAVAIFHNQKNAAGSIDLFRKSIRVCPDPKTYYELGNALMDMKDFQQSADAYRLALKLNLTPQSN